MNTVRSGPSSSCHTATSLPLLRPAVFEDYSQIQDLEARNGLRTRNRDDWLHLWRENPVYKRLRTWPIGWVFEDFRGQVVGHIANIPIRYELSGRELVAAANGDLAVDAEYRIYAFQLLGRFLSQKNVDLMLSTTANPITSRALEALGAARVPAGQWGRSSFWITNYDGFVKCLIAKRGVGVLKRLARVASAGLYLNDALARFRLRVANKQVDLNVLMAFDDRFDDFWQNLKAERPQTMFCDRSSEALRWHFQHVVTSRRASAITFEQRGRMVAYAVFFQYDNSSVGLRRMRLIDFQALEGHDALIVSAIAWGFAQCRRQGVHMLESVGLSAIKQQRIDAVAPYRRVLPAWPYYYKAASATLAAALKHPEAWDPSCFDGDASL